MRAALAALALIIALSSAYAFGLGEGNRFSKLGNVGIKKAAVVVSCPSPTAPNGAIDFSVCSNLTYVAVIF